jgi:hypothetical protein
LGTPIGGKTIDGEQSCPSAIITAMDPADYLACWPNPAILLAHCSVPFGFW